MTEQESKEIREKNDRDITAVQSLLAMSQWSPPSPDHCVSPTNDPLFSVLDPIQPNNLQLSPEKVRSTYIIFFSIYLIKLPSRIVLVFSLGNSSILSTCPSKFM